jgi:hypothetical protein
MSLGGFLEPSGSKLALAAAFFLLMPVPADAPVFDPGGVCDGVQECGVGRTTIPLPFGGLFLLVAPFVGGNQPFASPGDYLWKAPYLVASSYLAACAALETLRSVKKPRMA